MQMVLKRLKKEEKGFTLIELLAVIVILAVIAVIAVPLIGNIIKNTKADADVATARQVYDAARLYINGELSGVTPLSILINTDAAATNPAGLMARGYLDKNTLLPSTKEVITGGTVKYTTAGELDYVTFETTTFTATAPKKILASEIIDGKATR
ncbi:type IV pilus assembly protein PilA [Fontibacillus solani]|uniref:Type IV pilus assembly protein PilA n=1 Tax=Fontibacillus solani TaxID=1572857 RepID=A0A7W3XQ74_9BACL|nr:type II secretion system protein [Fontibacillus solani]MBA9084228.1 type IV pilus assembly protein PilA [Fontibacillus solani]